MSQPRPPFTIHGTRHHGEAPTAESVAEAGRLLYTTNLMASTAGIPVYWMSRPVPGGHVTATVHGPIVHKHTHLYPQPKSEDEDGAARLAWIPEGFVITPKSAAAPDGYGMPPTEDKLGTPGGPLREVIINRYKHNQYPDMLVDAAAAWDKRTVVPGGSSGGSGGSGGAMEASPVPPEGPVTPEGSISSSVAGPRPYAANLFYMDWELALSVPRPTGAPAVATDPTVAEPASSFSIGTGTQELWVAQFRKKDDALGTFGSRKVSRFDTVFREPQDTKWYCHRPEYGFESSEQRDMRETVNGLRAKVMADPPLKPLSPPLRGTEGILATTPVYLARMSGVLGHGSPDFREGHKTFEARMSFRDGLPVYGGENLLAATTLADPTLTRAAKAVNLLSESPGHYANMVHDWHLDSQAYAAMQSAIGPVNGIRAVQKPPYDLDSPTAPLDPPIDGVMASQIFMTHQYFAHFGACGREEEQETGAGGKKLPRKKRIGVTDGMSGAAFFSPFLTYSGDDPYLRPPVFMTFMGRRVYITKQNGQNIVAVLAARHIVTDTEEIIRAVVLERPMFFEGTAIEDHNPEFYGPTIRVIEGDAHDFFSTQKTLHTFYIPAKTSVMSTVKMSVSGEKAVFCYAEPVPCLKRFIYSSFVLDPVADEEFVVMTDPEVDVHQDGYETPYAHRRYVWGEKLHFVEWEEGEGFRDVITESLDITPTYHYETRTDELGETETDASIITTCQGSYKLFADYDEDEQLVYAKVHVDSEQRSILAVFDQDTENEQYTRRLRGKIEFPDASEFVFSEVDVGHPVPEGDSVTGLYRQILWVDIMHPDDIVYLQHDLEGNHTIKAAGTLYSRGEEVKDTADALKNETYDINLIRHRHESDVLVEKGRSPVLQDVVRQGGLTPFISMYDSTEAKTIISVAPYDANRYSPPFAYKARLVAAITGALNVGGRYYTEAFGKKSYYFSDLVGPEILFPSSVGFAQAEFYEDEAIVAGEFPAPFVEGRKVWGENDDDGFFYESSLDLKEITGIENLKNNILPIGVI